MYRIKSYILLLVALYLAACSTRAVVRPRSELIKEAKGQGVAVNSIEEDNKLFYAYENQQRARLLSLIEDRNSSESGQNPGYRLGTGDEIEINVFDVEELNTVVRVRPSGFISLPLLGAVKVKGKTEADLLTEVSSRLADFVRNPEVSLFISHYASQKVAVMGAVSKPGNYPLKKGANTIHELIGQAGGTTFRAGSYVNFIPSEKSANRDVTTVALTTSREELKKSSIELALDEILGTSGGVPIEVPVQGGDMIVIPEAGTVAVEGEVKKPGNYELKNRTTLLGGLAAAGGISYAAQYEEIELIRRRDGGKPPLRLVLNLENIASGKSRDTRLRNGDVIRVPSHSGRRLRQDTFESFSQLINFGVGGSVGF